MKKLINLLIYYESLSMNTDILNIILDHLIKIADVYQVYDFMATSKEIYERTIMFRKKHYSIGDLMLKSYQVNELDFIEDQKYYVHEDVEMNIMIQSHYISENYYVVINRCDIINLCGEFLKDNENFDNKILKKLTFVDNEEQIQKRIHKDFKKSYNPTIFVLDNIKEVELYNTLSNNEIIYIGKNIHNFSNCGKLSTYISFCDDIDIANVRTVRRDEFYKPMITTKIIDFEHKCDDDIIGDSSKSIMRLVEEIFKNADELLIVANPNNILSKSNPVNKYFHELKDCNNYKVYDEYIYDNIEVCFDSSIKYNKYMMKKDSKKENKTRKKRVYIVKYLHKYNSISNIIVLNYLIQDISYYVNIINNPLRINTHYNLHFLTTSLSVKIIRKIFPAIKILNGSSSVYKFVNMMKLDFFALSDGDLKVLYEIVHDKQALYEIWLKCDNNLLSAEQVRDFLMI